MRTTVSRKIVLTKGPGDEVVLSAGEETGTGFLPLVCQPASVRRAGPDGERTPARSSKMLRLRSKSLGTEWSEGRAAHHTTTTGLRAGFLCSSVQIEIPCEDCHSIWPFDDSKLEISANSSSSDWKLWRTQGTKGNRSAKTVARSSLPPEPNRALPAPFPFSNL